ncbi:MAG: metallophosphoesterase [Actinomycetota bacterium]
MDEFTLVAVLAGLLGVTATEFPALRERSSVTAVAAGVVAAAASTAVVLLAAGRTDTFTLIGHMSRLVFVVAPAVTALTVLRRRPTGFGRMDVAALTVATGVVAIGIYAVHVEPFWLRVDRPQVVVEMAGTGSVRIAVLADLQTDGVGDHEREAVASIMAGEPDIIVVAGDVFQGSDTQFEAALADLRGLLLRLNAPHGVYFVEGDSDRWDRADAMLADTGITRLDNRIVELEAGGRTVRLGGNRLDHASAPAAAMRSRLAASDRDDLVVLVSHRPDAVLDLPVASAVDLTIAGHTHGGQVQLPWFGPLLTLSDVPRAVAGGGLHEVDQNRIYVSTGVGVERAPAPRLRFLARPSVALIDVVPDDVPG